MGLFETKKEKLRPGCCAGTGGAERTGAPEAAPGVKVLGSGCAKCNALEQAVRAAVAHVTDFVQIASYGVMTTPALVVDGKVVSCGRVLRKEEAKTLIARARM